jgi:photosystem II stability/assembly factor-like uncharacterized protein
MNRALALSAFAAACMLSGCNKSPESAPAPATAAAPAKDSTMAGEKMMADSSKMMTDSSKMMTDSTKMVDSTMHMPADTAKK